MSEDAMVNASDEDDVGAAAVGDGFDGRVLMVTIFGCLNRCRDDEVRCACDRSIRMTIVMFGRQDGVGVPQVRDGTG
jgi:hypothetical protein